MLMMAFEFALVLFKIKIIIFKELSYIRDYNDILSLSIVMSSM